MAEQIMFYDSDFYSSRHRADVTAAYKAPKCHQI